MDRAVRSLRGRRQAGLFLVWSLLLVSVVPWRRAVLFTGGVDAVVLGKAAVGLVALVCAIVLAGRTRRHGRVGARSLIILLIVAAISFIGAVATGVGAVPSLVLSVRLVLVAATVTILVSSAPPLPVLKSLIWAFGAMALVAAVTGIQALTTDAVLASWGRLHGGIPPLHSNELALLAGVVMVAFAVDMGRRGVRPSNSLGLILFGTILVATGSRTALFATIVAVLLALILSMPAPPSATIALVAMVPIAYGLLMFTDVAEKTVLRGESAGQLATLSSRTIAWDAVLSVPSDTFAKWIGAGFDVKTVAVHQRWWDTQVLDSSWVSLLAQAGIIGALLVAIWVAATAIDSMRSDRMLRTLTLPLLVLIVGRSFLENGLIDSSTSFVLFLAVTLVLEPGTRFTGHTSSPGVALRAGAEPALLSAPFGPRV